MLPFVLSLLPSANALVTTDVGAVLRQSPLGSNTFSTAFTLGATGFLGCGAMTFGDTAVAINVQGTGSGMQNFIMTADQYNSCKSYGSGAVSCPAVVNACSCTTNFAVSFTSCVLTCVGLSPTTQYYPVSRTLIPAQPLSLDLIQNTLLPTPSQLLINYSPAPNRNTTASTIVPSAGVNKHVGFASVLIPVVVALLV